MENPDDDWYYNPNGTYSNSSGYWQYDVAASNPALFKNGGEGDPIFYDATPTMLNLLTATTSHVKKQMRGAINYFSS